MSQFLLSGMFFAQLFKGVAPYHPLNLCLIPQQALITSPRLFPFELSTQPDSDCLFLCFLPLPPYTQNCTSEEGHTFGQDQTASRGRRKTLLGGPGAGRGRRRRCSLGIVVKAAQRLRGRETAILRNRHWTVAGV